MREIKFRGRRLDNGEWIYGFYRQYPIFQKCGKCLDHINHFIDYEHNSEFVDPSTVGQYTGLKDKNDKEIYEGDIISVSYGHPGLDSSGVIEYRCGGFILRYRDHGYLNPVDFSDCDIRIIGNIHDNPELLKTE